MLNLMSIVNNLVIGFTLIAVVKISSGIVSSAKQTDKMRLAIVIRTDLGLDKGKSATQCAHAAISCYKKLLKRYPKGVEIWEDDGQSKVILKPDVAGEEVLLNLAKKAESIRLVTSIVRDFNETVTAVGIGPGSIAKINKVTGHLKLF